MSELLLCTLDVEDELAGLFLYFYLMFRIECDQLLYDCGGNNCFISCGMGNNDISRTGRRGRYHVTHPKRN